MLINNSKQEMDIGQCTSIFKNSQTNLYFYKKHCNKERSTEKNAVNYIYIHIF